MSYLYTIKLIKTIIMLYEIKIWKWDEVLHEGKFQFNNVKEATQYELGLFEGFRLAGKEPTGMSCMKVEEPKHDAVLIPVNEKFDYLILDEDNNWLSTGTKATEAELDQDIDDVGERMKEDGREDVTLIIFKAPELEQLSTTVNQ